MCTHPKKFSTVLNSKIFQDKKILVYSKPFIEIVGISLVIVRFAKSSDQTIIQIIRKSKSVLLTHPPPPPHKVSRYLFQKAFYGRSGIYFFRGNSAWASLLRGYSTLEINDRIMPRAGKFYKCIFQ